MKKTVFNSDNSAAYLPAVQTIITLSPYARGLTDAPARSKTPRDKDDEAGSSEMALWGDDNDFPQKVIADVRKDTELGPLVRKNAKLLCSGGVVWGVRDWDDDGNEILTAAPKAQNQKIAEFMDRSRIASRYLPECSQDLFFFWNAFAEFSLNGKSTEIMQLSTQAAENCRFKKMNSKGQIDLCYINANFPDAKEDDKLTIKLPVLDPYYAPAEGLREMLAKDKKKQNWIYPLSFASPGCSYYQLADWNGIRESGWLAISQAVPKFKLNLLENQLNIKFHVEIADKYWELKYPTFRTLKDEARKKIVADELKVFTDLMSGVEKSGNSLVTAMVHNAQTNTAYSLWKVTPIDNKIKAGEFLEEGKDASLNKVLAMGIHPALIGAVPNNGLGGAGSNIREAYNLHTFLSRAEQEVLLEPLTVVRDFNGWNSDIVFRMKNSFMETLDKGKEATETAAA